MDRVFPDWLSPEQVGAFEAHLELLMKWNRTINLIRFHDRAEAIERHYNEALFLARRLPEGALRIADVGSGAGFPGFPVAVARPDCTVTLIESHQRKAVFLREASRSVHNVRIYAGRAEARVENREASANFGDLANFDWAISRAVSYEDLVGVLPKLAPNAALLTGVEIPPVALGFEWEEAIALPGSKQRFLRLGHRV
jgi:16S rRNA (guanine(527)-N(7))-methyltransferase RsmG